MDLGILKKSSIIYTETYKQKGKKAMWTYTTVVKAKDIGKQIKINKKDTGPIVYIEYDGREYAAFDVSVSDDMLGYRIRWRDDDTDEMVKRMIELNPEKEFSIINSSDEGWVESFKCGIFGGEFKKWDKELFMPEY